MPPILLPRSIQVSRLLRGLGRHGCTRTLVTADTADVVTDAPRDGGLPDAYAGVADQVVRVPLNDRRGLFKRLFSGPARQPTSDEQLATWRERAEIVVADQIKTGCFNAMVTFAHPWESHELGAEIRRRHGVAWIAHFADPWYDNPYLSTRRSQVERDEILARERRVIEGADALIFVSDALRQCVMRKYPEPWLGKCHVVPHCYDEDLARVVVPKNETAGERPLTFVSVGNFYAERRIGPLLGAIRVLLDRRPDLRKRVKFRFIGSFAESPAQMVIDLGLADCVEILGSMPHVPSLQAIAAADVVLCVDAPFSESPFLPSKLVDYIAFRKPIIGGVVPGGASYEFLRRIGCRSVQPDDEEGFAQLLFETVENWPAAERIAGEYDRVALEFASLNVSRRFIRVAEAADEWRQYATRVA